MNSETNMIVIFGATGDLTKRKLIPSLYRLMERGAIPKYTPVVCLGRAALTQEQFLDHLEIGTFIQGGMEEGAVRLSKVLFYRTFDLENATTDDLSDITNGVRKQTNCSASKLFYLALPTTMFARVAELISPLLNDEGWIRVVFEKPFGHDLVSAEKLNATIGSVLHEDQIYRVDHYLGKELVQNIFFMRFANEIFSCSWNRGAIDNIQISVCETLGVEERAGYYDKSGAVRDMLQNHLLQLLSFVTMEPPLSGDANAIRDEAARVLGQLKAPSDRDVVLGQYTEGGGTVGYLDEDGIPSDSKTETYVALRAYIDNPRWKGVPIYLRTGKRLNKRYAEITVIFKKRQLNGLARQDKPNMITIRIQPDEGIALAFNVRKPGDSSRTESVLMDFCHHCHFGPNTPEAYEVIMSRAMQGDPLLFTRWDWLRQSWHYIDLLRSVAPAVVHYSAGSRGPREAELLLEQDGRYWHNTDSARRSSAPTSGCIVSNLLDKK